MSSTAVDPLCFMNSTVKAARRFYSTFTLPSFYKLYGDDKFLLQQNLAPVHSAKTTPECFAHPDIAVLNWPANLPDLNHIGNL